MILFLVISAEDIVFFPSWLIVAFQDKAGILPHLEPNHPVLFSAGARHWGPSPLPPPWVLGWGKLAGEFQEFT